jgi:hypothetical protein
LIEFYLDKTLPRAGFFVVDHKFFISYNAHMLKTQYVAKKPHKKSPKSPG